jgi:DUF177 domain-containing protein
MSILKIDLMNLRSGSYKVEGRIQARQLNPIQSTDYTISGPLVLRLRISTTDQLTYFVSGSISYGISGECVRCLVEFLHEQEVKVTGVFAFPEAIAKLDLTPEQLEDEGIFPLKSEQKTIDLTELILETVILDYPRYLKCSEDCKGLCPLCGCNLNEKSCNCRQQQIDPRWAKLTELERK